MQGAQRTVDLTCCGESNPGRGSRERVMRKRYRVLMFASLVAALVVPVGYALSVESTPVASHPQYASIVPAAAAAVVPVAAAAVAAPLAIHVSSAAAAAAAPRPAV